MNRDVLTGSVRRAAFAVLIVFSVAVVIAVSDPRPSGGATDGDARVTASGLRDPASLAAAEADFASAVAAEANDAQQTPTAVPATPEPTPTPLPTQDLAPIITRFARNAGLSTGVLPAACTSTAPIDGPTPILFDCEPGTVAAVDQGRVLLVSGSGAETSGIAPRVVAPWSWSRGASLGRFVVVDHGTTGRAQTAISVYWNLTSIDPDITTGTAIEPGQPVGTIEALAGETTARLGWELWMNNRLEQIDPPDDPPTADVALATATELGLATRLPAPSECPFPSGEATNFPNSARTYRAGVHQGIDFNCPSAGFDATAAADGTIAMIVSDYMEAIPSERNAILASAADAGSTPFWILMTLYGNFVVVDHGDDAGVGQVFTLYAHLESVDEGLTLGAPISAGDRIGEIGASGTSAASRNAVEDEPASIHLHWEMLVDDHYLSEGLSAAATEQVYRSLFCQNEDDLSCSP